jgi:hypothetical protein
MSFLTVGWEPVVNAGLLPQHPGDGASPVATVGWLPKLGTAFYPYPGDDPEAGDEPARPPAAAGG